jgi:DNA-binding NarL/FixJ family response regulator
MIQSPPAAEAVEGIPKLAPDVVIMDVNLPDTTFQALAAGAHGYLVKPVLPERLLEAIREIMARRRPGRG